MARRDDKSSKSFTTINKDGKAVWEPGLPPMVTARRVHKTPKVVPEEAKLPPVACDLKTTLKLGASAKAEWLEKAIKGISSGRAKVQDVFNIVTHPKFASGVPERIGQRMLQTVVSNLDVFSDKQRMTLVSKCKLAEVFSADGTGRAVDQADDDEESAESRPRRRSRSRSRSRAPPEEATWVATDASPSSPRGEVPPRPSTSGMSEQEQQEMEAAFTERLRKQEDEKLKHDQERKALAERERRRKAKLGSAFQFGGDSEDEETGRSAKPARKSSQEDGEDRPLSFAASGLAAAAAAAAVRTPYGEGQDPRFVEAMGGDKLLAEAHKILQSAAGSGRLGALPPTSRSPSRRRRRRSRSRSGSRSRVGARPDTRSSGSYRSPTPDGRARGQARAARKAKMIASLMGRK